MGTDDSGAGKIIASGRSLAGDLKLALPDQTLKRTPDRCIAGLGRDMTPYLIPASTRMGGDVIEDNLIDLGHETILEEICNVYLTKIKG